MAWKIAVCDDEVKYLDQLHTFLNRYAREKGLDFEILRFSSADELLMNYPRDLDLLLLDIAMGGVDGMEAAREIRRFDNQVCIIFITTMHHCAIEGYAVRAFGFIKKPVSEAELRHELRCALAQIENSRAKEQFLTIKTAGTLHRIPISQITYCEVRNHNLLINTTQGCYQSRSSIGDVEEKLGPMGFFRCHSSYLVNGEFISKIEATQLCLNDGTVIPISQRKKKEFMNDLAAHLGGMI